MKKEELRIGNKYDSDDSILTITAANIGNIALGIEKGIKTSTEPIPLTKDWLIEIGLADLLVYPKNDGDYISYNELNKEWSYNIKFGDKAFRIKILKFVHQAQNIFIDWIDE